MTKLIVLLSFFVSAVGFAAAAKFDANEIMKRNDDAKRLSQVQANAVLQTASGSDTRVKKFTWWRKLGGDAIHYSILTRFHFPAEIKGEGILFLEHANQDPDVQLYLPSYKKIRRVESSAQSGSFMGSEFSYTDVLGGAVSDFKYLAKKDETCAKVSCYVIEATPANDAVKARAGFDKRVDWVQSDNFMIVASEYYGADGKLRKKLQASQIVEVDAAHHKWMAEKLQMENILTKKSTEIQFSEVEAMKVISDTTFTTRNLEKGL